MKIIVSEHSGFCSGVKRAVETVNNLLEQRKKIVTLGEIIHNTQVVEDLKLRGAKVVYSVSEIENMKKKLEYLFEDITVVIRSHGITKNSLSELISKNINYVDSTCPFVKKIHNIIEQENHNKNFLLVSGTKMHPEIEGICSRFSGKYFVFRNLEEFKKIYEYNKELFDSKSGFLVSQTTFLAQEFKNISEFIKQNFSNIKIYNTICNVTDLRQSSTEKIAKLSDLMIVIGSHQSSNTLKLVDICNKYTNTILIETWSELEKISDFTRFDTIGLTAGSSTPLEELQKAQNYLENISKN